MKGLRESLYLSRGNNGSKIFFWFIQIITSGQSDDLKKRRNLIWALKVLNLLNSTSKEI